MKTRLLSLLLLLVISLVSLTAPVAASFNPFCKTDSSGNCVSGPCKDAPNSPTCQQNANQSGKTTDPAVDIIRKAANLIAVVAGVAAVIVIIISGFQFVTAGGASPGQRSGDPNKIKTARATLSNALIGLVIIALAWTIVTFVTNHFIG